MVKNLSELDASSSDWEQNADEQHDNPRDLGGIVSRRVMETLGPTDYELTGPLSGRMVKYLDSLSEHQFAGNLQKYDAIAVAEAISEVVNVIRVETRSGGPDSRFDESKFKALLFRMMIGFTNPEIAHIEGVSLDAVEASIKRIKARIREKAGKGDVDFEAIITKKVEQLRGDKELIDRIEIENITAYGLADLPKPRDERQQDPLRKRQERLKRQIERGDPIPRQVRTKKAAPQKTAQPLTRRIQTVVEKTPATDPVAKVESRPTPAAMPPRKASEVLFEKYKPAAQREGDGDDENCPEFTTIWGTKTLSVLYDTLQDHNALENPATIIAERVDGRDKSRRADPEVLKALRQLRRLSSRCKTDFGNDDKKKAAFDMLTVPANGRFNTLGDICRTFKNEYPELDDYDVASILAASITDVLKDSQSVLVVHH